MSSNLTSVDISSLKLPDLFRLVEEVQATRTPRILKRDSEPVAMLMPVGAAILTSDPSGHTTILCGLKQPYTKAQEHCKELTGQNCYAILPSNAARRAEADHCNVCPILSILIL
jgi:hypothetical protein